MFLNKLPLADRIGTYSVHKRISEATDGASGVLWRRCSGYALVLAPNPVEGCEFKPYNPSPQLGQTTRFELVAEVSGAKKPEGLAREARGIRTDLVLAARHADPTRRYDDIARDVGTAWLERQGERHGFKVKVLAEIRYETLEFKRKDRMIRIGTIAFSGQLEITEANSFRSAMLNGIGHSKAWGCGLLLCLSNQLHQ